jgi:hypothetical protein
LLILHNDQRVPVNDYSDELKPLKGILVATVATLYQDATTRDTYILIIHQALYFGKRLRSSLLNPNQLRNGGLVVEDVPRQFDHLSSHSISECKVRIPLQLEGIISGFESRAPTWEEYNDSDIPHYEIASCDPWLPASDDFAANELTIAKVSTTPLTGCCADKFVLHGPTMKHIAHWRRLMTNLVIMWKNKWWSQNMTMSVTVWWTRGAY